MLLNSFYKIIGLEAKEDQIKTQLQLNPEHPIFKGHFPENPIVPGVCFIQIIKEILQDFYAATILIAKITNLKFLFPVDPREHREIEILLGLEDFGESQKVRVIASLPDETPVLKGIMLCEKK